MKVKKYLEQVAYIGESDIPGDDGKIYYSKFDGSYITRVGQETNIAHLAEMEITENLTQGVGFSPKDKKWYGWSHRAMYGFKIGSTCKKGDCHYIGSTLQEQEDAAVLFWSDADRINTHCDGIITYPNGEKFFHIKWTYTGNIPNTKLHNKISGVEHFITPLGAGEWTAKTMEDAHQMAKDFSKGVS